MLQSARVPGVVLAVAALCLLLVAAVAGLHMHLPHAVGNDVWDVINNATP